MTETNTLLEELENLHKLISQNWNDPDEDFINNSVTFVRVVLEKLHIPVTDINERIERCKCIGRKIFCLTSALVQAYILYLDSIAKAIIQDEGKSSEQDIILSVVHQNQISFLLCFVVNTGLIRHLEFQLSVIAPKPCVLPKCSDLDLFICCRHIISLCHNEVIRNLLLPKNLHPLLAALMQLAYSSKFSDILEHSARRWCLSALAHLLTKWSKLEDVVTSLLMLQGSTSRSAPAWLLNACGKLLSKCLLKKNGVVCVISVLISTLDSEMSAWKKAELISHILSTTPHGASGKKEYYINICSQIIALFQSDDLNIVKDSESFWQVLVETVFSLYKKSLDLTRAYFFKPLFRPFESCYEIKESGELNNLGQSLKVLHQLFVLYQHPDKNSVAKDVMIPYLSGFFSLYCFSRNTVSYLQSLLCDLIMACLQIFEGRDAACLLLCLCGIKDPDHASLISQIKNVVPGLYFSFNEDNDVNLSYEDPQVRTPEYVLADQDNKVQSIMEIMTLCKDKQLATHVLIQLIKNMDQLDEIEESQSSNKLMMSGDKVSDLLQQGESQLITFALLMSICETSDPRQLLTDVDEICSFIKIVLGKSVKKDSETFHVETLKTCFAVLGICMLNELTRSEQHAMQDLIPLLQDIAAHEGLDRNERETASDLAIAIATNGVCSDLDMTSFSKSLQLQMEKLDIKPGGPEYSNICAHSSDESSNDEDINIFHQQTGTYQNTKRTPPLIEEIPESKPLQAEEHNEYKEKVYNLQEQYAAISATETDNSVSSVSEALSDVYDPSPPVRAAAFRFLTDSFKSGLKEAKDKEESIYRIFLERLETENEPFVYLSAVQGLAELANRTKINPGRWKSLLDRLIDEYDKYIGSNDEEADVKAAKLGEVLVRVARQLGDFAPLQSRKLIPVFFRGACSKRPHVRASCLSNLGELCSKLHHSLSSFSHELSECVCNIARTDQDVIVRRSAIHVIRSLLDALGPRILQVFPDNVKQFYAALKHGYDIDDDDVVQLHAQLALESLDNIMRDVIFNENTRKHQHPHKKIVVLP
ncbi:transport and Golgi organization protein 6 homolog isoform X1 [Clavelina lepadiformis]|uniref:transport and Golgi organization protein 6 homolog isoform X1 n=1 Tax=Clavelina lepadiformis TaxID=159417 RepID=UPI004042E8A2